MADKQKALPGTSMSEGTRTPIEAGIIDRVVQGVRYMITGSKPDEWFGPGQPVAPQAQDKDGVKGRAFDYPVNTNMRRLPRDGEGVTFEQMRALADGYDLLRLVIETRKDQMSKMKWTFKPKDAKAQPDTRCEELKEFFAFPDGEHDWETWLRMLLEEMLVIDAATVYPRPTLDGGVYALELVDGATVKRVLDSSGRTPLPPDPAYQQVLKGMPAVDYSRDELIYKPRNPRVHKVYGYSPVEQIILTVNIALRRQVSQLQYYTEGNTPEALIGVPPEWNPDQIKQFQDYWDSILEGNTAARRHTKFVPGGMSYNPTRESVLKDDFDEWLAKVIAFAFSISPQALIKQMNRASADSAKDQALSEGLIPVMNWIKNLVDYIIWKYWGYSDLEFGWEEDDETSPLVQMQVLTGYVQAKIMQDDEARDKLGLDPLTADQRTAMTPPPPPALAGDGKNVPGDPNQDPGSAAPTQTAAKPQAGSTDKPVGKLQKASATHKLKPVSRTRAKVQDCTNDITRLIQPALTALKKRVSKELGSKVGKAITASDQAKRLIEELTFEELQDLAPELAEILEDMAADGGAEALAQVVAEVTKDQLDQVNGRAVAYAEERSARLVTNLEDSTRDMLRSTVVQAIEEGWSNDQLADELSANYAFSDERADCIARTETAYADVQGNLDGYKASGVVESKHWILAQDQYCDDCATLDGVIVGIDEDFPGDGGDGPPLHPNCRCDVIPVLKEDDQ